jgi:hypothetical protein
MGRRVCEITQNGRVAIGKMICRRSLLARRERRLSDSTSQKDCTVFRNPVFSIAMLTASVLCATSAYAQSGTRGGYSSPASSSPAFPSGSIRSSQPQSGYYQSGSVNSTPVQSGVSFGQGQTCINGSCSTRNAAYPVVSSAAAPIMHSTYSVAQHPTVSSSVQPIYNAYYPQQSSVPYSPYTVHYSAARSFSTAPASSCSGSVSSYGHNYR